MLSFITHSLNTYSVLDVEEQNDKVTNMQRGRPRWLKINIIRKFRVRRRQGNQICVERRSLFMKEWKTLRCVKRK